MPPSGFSQKAINGLLLYVQASYESAQAQYQTSGASEKSFLELLSAQAKLLSVSEQGRDGLATFVAECFLDLAKEIELGKDKHNRPVTDGKAIQKELDQIGNYLKKFTI